MLTIEKLSFSYDKKNVLVDFDLVIPQGEVWALLGRSGCGKTTLLNLTAGLLQPKAGKVMVDGTIVNGPGLIRGIVFQEDSLLDWLDVLSNVLFPNHKTASIQSKELAIAHLKSAGLEDAINLKPYQLSAGMRKRVEFLRTIFADDRFLLADEPFSLLDPLTRRSLWKMFSESLKTHPRTGLITTHDPEEAVRLADAIVVMARSHGAKPMSPIRLPLYVRLSIKNGEKSALQEACDKVMNVLIEAG